MTRHRLFSWWQRLVLLLFLALVIVQILFLGGHIPWIATTPPISNISVVVGTKNADGDEQKPRPVKKQRPTFQTGIVFPQWGKDAYSKQDSDWQAGLQEISLETGATWVSLTLNFIQDSLSSTQVQVGKQTPTLQAFTDGIRLAREDGFSVFVQPLITVQGAQPWSGAIKFADEQDASAWFASYWQVYQPYIAAAAQAGANELALGTEYERLQPWTVEWNQLIAHAHAIFPGLLTYDINFTSLGLAHYPAWMQNPMLTCIGVSAYIPLTDIPQRLPPAILPWLWREKIGKSLDDFSTQIGKPVLISEIGYRNSPDALYQPWAAQRLAGTDPQEQAAAYDAALQNVLVDSHLAGVFFWAWSLPPYAPNGEPAAATLRRWYTSSMA